MSVMTKMISTDRYLYQIYRDVKAEVKQQSDLRTEMSQARKLEAVLTQVKYLQKKYAQTGKVSIDDSDNFPFATFWSKAEQIAMMKQLYETNSKLFTKGAFIDTFSGSESQAYQLGESLEAGFARFVRTVAANASNQSYADTKGVIKSKVGGLHTQVPDLIGETNEIMKAIFNDCYQQASVAMKQYKKSSELPGNAKGMHSVQGKIDNIGLSAEFVASVEVQGMEKMYLWL